MQKTEPDADPAGKFIPVTVRKRAIVVNDMVENLEKRRFKKLDEADPDELKKVVEIVSDLHPEHNYYKIREYAKVAIRLWNKRRSSK